MKNRTDDSCKQEIEWIKDVARTNLMAADRIAFGKLAGRDLSQNSVATNLKNTTPFIIHAIWNELSHIVTEESRGHLTLWAVLKHYREASDYCNRNKYLLHYDEAQLTLMLDYAFFNDTQLMPSRNTLLDKKWKRIEEADIDFRFVLLICLRVLPLYSGKSPLADHPLATLREFLRYYISREEFPFLGNLPYLEMIIDEHFDIYERMAAIIVLVNLCITTCELPTTKPVARRNANISTLQDITLWRGAQGPQLWQEEGKMTSFWYFVPSQDGCIMRRCDYTKREYVDYTLHLGTEFSKDTGRLLEPHFILNMVENSSLYEYLMLIRWRYQQDQEGNITVFELDSLSSWNTKNNWADRFRHFQLKRMDTSDRSYQTFADCFVQSADALYSLSRSFSNKYPETSYFFAHTLYAITQDNLVIRDIQQNEDGEYEYIPNKVFNLPRDYAAQDFRLSDPIGLLIVGEDPMKQKKYINIDDLSTCYAIENDEIVLPPRE